MTSDPIARFEREYIDYHRISGERARQQLKLLLQFEATLDGMLVDAEGEDLQAFAGWLLKEGNAGTGYHVNTVRKKLNQIRPFYSWAYAVRLVTAEQYMGLRGVKDPRGATGNTLPKPYTRKELDDFWATLETTLPLIPKSGQGSWALKNWLTGRGPWSNVWKHAMRIQIEAMIHLALHLGLRRHEIFGLSLDDLHYDNDYLVIRGKADPNTGEPKVRQVPFTDKAREAVQRWVEFRALLRPDHGAAWLSCWGSTPEKPMPEDRFNMLLNRRLAPQWRWHRFRHTCATEWLRAGTELETVSRLLGHATLQQTLSYAEILKSDIARKLGKNQAVFNEAVGNRAA